MLDVNGTRYHLLFGRQDWERCRVESGKRKWEYVKDRHVVRLQAEIFAFSQQGAAAAPLKQEARRGATRDPFGHWYWIDEDKTRILALWAAASQPEVLFPTEPGEDKQSQSKSVFQPATPVELAPPEPLEGLAVVNDGYLVAGSPTTGTLLVFDLYALDGGAIRLPLPAPPNEADKKSVPYDLAPLPEGGLLILDRAHKTVWRLDNAFRLAPGEPDEAGEALTFQPKQGEARRRRTKAPAEPIDLGATQDPVSIEALPDGSFWVLDNPEGEGASQLWLCNASNNVEPQQIELLTANLVEEDADDLDLLQIRVHDLAYLPDRQAQGFDLNQGTLFVADISGNQSYALFVDLTDGLELRIARQYFPMRGFTGTALVAEWSNGEAYYHQGQRWLPLKELPKMRYEEEATMLLPVFDGRDPGCVWHRLCIDACIPPETTLLVETRASDIEDDLSWQAWQTQPAPYKRPNSSELPYASFWSEAELDKPNTGTWELLFQQTQGRYVQMRLTLVGNVRNTPTLRALRAYYPRYSYLKTFLPAAYQQDPVSTSFMEKFLANPEGIFTTVEGLIVQAQYLMDVNTIPSEAVDWLASWLGLVMEPGWTDYQRRLLIAQAPYFFQRRGTLPGLMQLLLLTVYPELGPKIFRDDIDQFCTTIRIVERFLTRSRPAVDAGDPTEQEIAPADEDRAHIFTVMLPTTIEDSTWRLVERIVDLEKPAHTSFTVKQYWALFRVGEVRLGLDTVLGQGSRFETFRLGQTGLAEGVLGAAFPYNLTSRTVVAN